MAVENNSLNCCAAGVCYRLRPYGSTLDLERTRGVLRLFDHCTIRLCGSVAHVTDHSGTAGSTVHHGADVDPILSDRRRKDLACASSGRYQVELDCAPYDVRRTILEGMAHALHG